ncbi:DUF2283 domain-containing protein [Deinococcus marmoris]|uniref:DUF2283 domain-containing protein n=1 Tax=Deinococcus marmoris TaxID=249408 RepID=A0A1U7P4Z3_9DEIO|nr:DUF2283 domain-containing protein [Deinococcus marmoris]OLV20228.1 hypothetical protein BOO71_0000712 [Deinococcus marmoris]
MEIRIDTEADAAYIRLRKGKVHRTEELGEGYMLDFSRAGKVIGIEVLHLSKKSAGVLGVDVPERVWKLALSA